MSLVAILNRAATRVAHAIFDPSRPARRSQPAIEPASNPSPPASAAMPNQATKLVELAKQVGALPAAVMMHPNQPLVVPADQLVSDNPLLRRQYTPRSLLN